MKTFLTIKLICLLTYQSYAQRIPHFLRNNWIGIAKEPLSDLDSVLLFRDNDHFDTAYELYAYFRYDKGKRFSILFKDKRIPGMLSDPVVYDEKWTVKERVSGGYFLSRKSCKFDVTFEQILLPEYDSNGQLQNVLLLKDTKAKKNKK